MIIVSNSMISGSSCRGGKPLSAGIWALFLGIAVVHASSPSSVTAGVTISANPPSLPAISNCRQFFGKNRRGLRAQVSWILTSSVERAITSWSTFVVHRQPLVDRCSLAIGRQSVVTTRDFTSVNPPTLDSAINGLLPTLSHIPLLIHS